MGQYPAAFEHPQAVKVPSDAVRVMKTSCIPWTEQTIELLKDMNIVWETLRPIIKILLIAKFAFLPTGKAPFDATLFPPRPNPLAFIPHKRHELHAVPSARCRAVVLVVKRMVRNQNGFPRPTE